jgi:hypothetical protein
LNIQGQASLPKVLVNSVPKSGTNLLMQTILGIPGMVKDQDSFYHRGNYKQLLQMRQGQFAVGHIPYNADFSRELSSNSIKHIFIYRDLRDVAVSWNYYFDKMREHLLYPVFQNRIKNHDQRLLAVINGVQLLESEIPSGYSRKTYPSIYEEFKPIYDWLKVPEVCHIKFEDLVRNNNTRNTTLNRIVSFLWDDLRQFHLKKSDLVRMMEQNIDPKASRTFREGKIGGWCNEFNEEHKAAFKRIAGDFLIELGYEQNNDW